MQPCSVDSPAVGSGLTHQAAWYWGPRLVEKGAFAVVHEELDWVTAQAQAQSRHTGARAAVEEESGALGAAPEPLHEGHLDLIVEVSSR